MGLSTPGLRTTMRKGWFWGHFDDTLGSFGVTLGTVWLWGSLWDHCGVTLGIWKSVFKKHSFSQTDFNDFIQLWCQLGATLGALWDHFWHTRVTLGYFGANSGAHWNHFGHLRATLGHHEVTLSHFRGFFGGTFDTWGRLWDDFGLFGGDFGITWGSLWVILGWLWDHFGIILHTHGSLCGHFGYMRFTLESLWSIFKK